MNQETQDIIGQLEDINSSIESVISDVHKDLINNKLGDVNES